MDKKPLTPQEIRHTVGILNSFLAANDLVPDEKQRILDAIALIRKGVNLTVEMVLEGRMSFKGERR